MNETDSAPATQAPSAGAPGSTVEPGMQTDLARMQAELREANERVLRVQAELENYRKRVRREMEDERKYAVLPLVRDLLPAVDNLQRAIDVAEPMTTPSGLLDGVKMVLLQLSGVFEQQHCKRIAATPGAAFDPHLHEALAQEPSPTVPAGAISREVRAGYQLHDRVIRPAQVFVSKGATG